MSVGFCRGSRVKEKFFVRSLSRFSQITDYMANIACVAGGISRASVFVLVAPARNMAAPLPLARSRIPPATQAMANKEIRFMKLFCTNWQFACKQRWAELNSAKVYLSCLLVIFLIWLFGFFGSIASKQYRSRSENLDRHCHILNRGFYMAARILCQAACLTFSPMYELR